MADTDKKTPEADTDKNTPAAAKASEARKVRVLHAHLSYACNQVVELPGAEADAAVAGGWADDHPDAVAHAEANEKQPDAEA